MTQVQTRPHASAGAVRRVTHGNNARALNWAPAPGGPGHAPAPAAPAPRRRTPLSVVPAARSRRRAPVVVFCFVALILGLGAVLLLNISVSSGQYQLVELQNERTELMQRNEALTQQLENHQAPQMLAAQAAELGMVTSSSFGSIDLQTLEVTGNPVPAEESEGPAVLIPAPEVLTQPVAPQAAGTEAEETGESARAAEAREEEAAETGPVPASPADGWTAPATPEADLNGGTIPAPAQIDEQ